MTRAGRLRRSPSGAVRRAPRCAPSSPAECRSDRRSRSTGRSGGPSGRAHPRLQPPAGACRRTPPCRHFERDMVDPIRRVPVSFSRRRGQVKERDVAAVAAFEEDMNEVDFLAVWLCPRAMLRPPRISDRAPWCRNRPSPVHRGSDRQRDAAFETSTAPLCALGARITGIAGEGTPVSAIVGILAIRAALSTCSLPIHGMGERGSIHPHRRCPPRAGIR